MRNENKIVHVFIRKIYFVIKNILLSLKNQNNNKTESYTKMKRYNNRFIYFICAVSALGGLLFGYDWVVIGGAKIFYEQFFQIVDNPNMQGLAMSIALAGCLLGALTTGTLADTYGRKPLLIVAAFIFLVSAYGTGAYDNFVIFFDSSFCRRYSHWDSFRFVSNVYCGNFSG